MNFIIRICINIYRRGAVFIFSIAGCILLLSIIGLGFLEFSEDFLQEVKAFGTYQKAIELMKQNFESENIFIIGFKPDKDMYSEESSANLSEITNRLSEVSGIQKVISPANARNLVIQNDGSIAFVPLLRERSADTFKNEITATDVFQEYFVSHDKTSFLLYCIPEPGVNSKQLLDTLHKTLTPFKTDIRIFGKAVLDKTILSMNYRDFIILGSIALLIIWLVELFFTRSIISAFILTGFSAFPTVITLSLFPVLGCKIEMITLLVPVLVIVLSTTYMLHYLHYFCLFKAVEESLRYALPVILIASATTLLGFGTMVLSPVTELFNLGVTLSIGIFFSAAPALLLLPQVVKNIPLYINRNRALPAFLINGLRGKIIIPVFMMLFGIGIFGITQLESGFVFGYKAKENTPLFNLNNDLDKTLGGRMELDILIDSEEEYGLVIADRYKSLDTAVKQIDNLSGTGYVYSITKFTNWINGRLSGNEPALLPENSAEIGESFELLTGRDLGIGASSLINTSYSITRIKVRFYLENENQASYKAEYLKLKQKISSILQKQLPECSIMFLGILEKSLQRDSAVTQSILYSVIIFFPTVFLFLLFIQKSFLYPLITILPSASASVFMFGLMGICNLGFVTTSILIFCCLIGVAVDDAVFLVQFYLVHGKGKNTGIAVMSALKNSGRVIIRTTVIIVAGLAVLLFGSWYVMVWHVLLLIVGLSFATAVTLFVIPVLLRHFGQK